MTSDCDLEETRGWIPSNTHPPNTRIVASCCDTLYITLNGKLREEPMEELEALRERALPPRKSRTPQPVDYTLEAFEVDGIRFAYKAAAKNGTRHRLSNEDITILVTPNIGKEIARIQVQLRAFFLWREGWHKAALSAERAAASLLEGPFEPESSTLSRVDLCVDFQGWIPERANESRFVTRARHESHWKVNDQFTGFSFGKGNITCRIYNKTVEIQNSSKQWMEAIWQQGDYSPQAPVWRLEFQLRRTALRQMGLDCVTDLSSKGQPAWHYCTNKWIRLVIQLEGSRHERCPTDPNWSALQVLPGFDSKGGEIVRIMAKDAQVETVLRTLGGCTTTLAALLDYKSLDRTLRMVRTELQKELTRRDVTFTDAVDQRALKKGFQTA